MILICMATFANASDSKAAGNLQPSLLAPSVKITLAEKKAKPRFLNKLPEV